MSGVEGIDVASPDSAPEQFRALQSPAPCSPSLVYCLTSKHPAENDSVPLAPASSLGSSRDCLAAGPSARPHSLAPRRVKCFTRGLSAFCYTLAQTRSSLPFAGARLLAGMSRFRTLCHPRFPCAFGLRLIAVRCCERSILPGRVEQEIRARQLLAARASKPARLLIFPVDMLCT